ncbi:flagellar FliJ protein [Paenibacillus sp. DS2015]|uniref:flagellar export protein FliJ n=1 Tax=Paenibacillus sp. DS2015 TaxID=3373917 RepID=UPI003D24D75C
MRFHYAFQNIVDLKSNEKSQAEWMLSTAIGKLQDEERSLRELQTSRKQMADQLQSDIENAASVAKIREIQTYVDHLDQCIKRKHTDVHRANVVVIKSKDHLTTKMLDEKVWMKSREKEKDKFQHEMLLKEQNELDEIATVRFAMNSR